MRTANAGARPLNPVTVVADGERDPPTRTAKAQPVTAPESPRVLLLAREDVDVLADTLTDLRCEVFVATDLFEAMAEVADTDPDAVVLDLTMTRDDAHAMAEWLAEQDLDTRVIGLVEPVAGAAASELQGLCDELVTVPVDRSSLAAALGMSTDDDEPRTQLTVKVNADLLDAHEVKIPPRSAGDDGDKPALIVGLGAHAEAPRYDE